MSDGIYFSPWVVVMLAALAAAAVGLTLPQAVLLLQPVLRCWAGRCRNCRCPAPRSGVDR
jgi:hypothetical protein